MCCLFLFLLLLPSFSLNFLHLLQQKYFDSGDYQMAKQKPAPGNKSRMPPLLAQPTGEAIPTPESVPVRKTSIIQHTKLTTAS